MTREQVRRTQPNDGHTPASDTRMTERPVLLDGRAAISCARVTHNKNDKTGPAKPHEVPAELQRLFDLGNAHEAELFDIWLDKGTDVVDLCDLNDDTLAHTAATLESMSRGRLVILGGRLPDDSAGGRTGKPDVLLREAHGNGYHPCDVKAHKVLDKKLSGGLVSDVGEPSLAAAITIDLGLRNKSGDLLQLAHYWRMLQACGHQAAQPWGAIAGTDPGPLPRLAWYDLAQPLFKEFSPSTGKTRSSLDCYDREHDFRIRIAQTAQQRTGSATDPEALVAPIGQKECRLCPWAPVCVDRLPLGDLSRELLGSLSVHEYVALRQHGITTVADLADADLKAVLDSAYADATPEQVGRAHRLQHAQASAQLARDGFVLRLKPGAAFILPRADVEVDLDMECTREGLVYLWGVLVTRDGVSAYRDFTDIAVDDDASELAVARRCFDWLVTQHPTAEVFHYGHVEHSHATRILRGHLSSYAGTVADPSTWVDMLPAARNCLESRSGLGLKVVATKGAGFNWRDEDPGGLASQDWLDAARAGDSASQKRILNYNEDDVRATLAVRSWLRRVVNLPDDEVLPTLTERASQTRTGPTTSQVSQHPNSSKDGGPRSGICNLMIERYNDETGWCAWAPNPLSSAEARAILAGLDESAWRAVDWTSRKPVDIWIPSRVW